MRPYTVLCGGLGGSRFVDALARAAGPESVTAVGNVGDDVEVFGLHVSPDLDTVLYTLAGLLDEERGWGSGRSRSARWGWPRLWEPRRGSRSATATSGFTSFGASASRQGSRSLASSRSSPGRSASRSPCSPLPTIRSGPILTTPEGELPFQDWFVRRRHEDTVLAVRYEGSERARPAPGVLEAVEQSEVVFLAPSNPFVSIGPILAVAGVAEAVAARDGLVVALSPIVAGAAVRGPLAAMLESLGHEPTALGVARLYEGVASTFVLDPADEALAPAVEVLGLRAVVTPIVMVRPDVRGDVGRAVLEAVA